GSPAMIFSRVGSRYPRWVGMAVSGDCRASIVGVIAPEKAQGCTRMRCGRWPREEKMNLVRLRGDQMMSGRNRIHWSLNALIMLIATARTLFSMVDPA